MINITPEQIEKLKQRANVSYDEAKQALEKCNGDILDALILLENQNQYQNYNTNNTYNYNQQPQQTYQDQSSQQYNQNYNNFQNGEPNMNYQNNYGYQDQNYQYNYQQQNQQYPNQNYQYNYQYQQPYQKPQSKFSFYCRKAFNYICNLVKLGNKNHFVVTKDNKTYLDLPITIFVILLLAAFYIAIPLLVIGIFFGFKYKFYGPEVGKTAANDKLDKFYSKVDSVINDHDIRQ